MSSYHIGMPLFLRALLSILILPVNVMVVIPVFLIWVSGNSAWGGNPRETIDGIAWLSFAACVGGFVLMAWTVTDFLTTGDGTLAPWDPPKKLVIKGPYQFVRNPMISGVILVLFAETLILHAWIMAAWLAFFILANAIYLPWIEEPELERRFGDDYRLYKENVPRWIPRFTPWSLPE